MKRLNFFAFTMMVACFASPLGAQVSKPIYVSLPGPGNIQHAGRTHSVNSVSHS